MDSGNEVEARVRGYYVTAGVLVASNLRLWDFGEGYWSTAERIGGTYEHPEYAPPYAERLPEGVDPEDEHIKWSGELDLLVRDSDDRLYVGDMKKINSFRKRKLPPIADDPADNAAALQRAEPKYAAQLFQYIDKFGATLGVEGEAFLHIEDSNFNGYEIRWVRPGPEQIAWAYERSDEAVASSRLGVLIPQPFAKSSTQCRACRCTRLCNMLRAGDTQTHKIVATRLKQVRA